ncbi:(2Fe-2S)-binding protein [bacterium]|jgi:NAD(P)H-nitrite reductase large subunit|nr:(2Fe-2S)-binding protein [bacterium]
MAEDEERLICFCNNVTYAELVKAIKAGAKTLDDIQRETLASTGCGGCEWEVREILDNITKELAAQKTGTE